MGNELVIQSLEDLLQFANDHGVVEIALRAQNKRFRAFQKIMIQNLQQTPAKKDFVEDIIHLLYQNNKLNEHHFEMLTQLTNIENFNLLLSGLNLCATCAGFAIMYKKLDDMNTRLSRQLKQLDKAVKKNQDLQYDYEFSKILSEHNNMLDCRRIGQPYSERQMRELLDAEYNLLRYLLKAFREGLTDNHSDLITAIFSLLDMFTITLLLFDEAYYYNHLDVLAGKDPWHGSHQKWMGIYHDVTTPFFVEKLQDFAFFELELSTEFVDYYYRSLIELVKDMLEDVEDNQKLLIAAASAEQFRYYKKLSDNAFAESIKTIIEKAGDGMSPEEIDSTYQSVMAHAAVA